MSRRIDFCLTTFRPLLLWQKSHPKIKDALFSYRQVLQQWNPHVDPTTAGIVCRCSEILRRHPQLTVVQGHVASSATLLHLPAFLEQVAQSSCGNTVFMSAKDHWKTFHAVVREWISHHELVNYPTSDIRRVWEEVAPIGLLTWCVNYSDILQALFGMFGIIKALTLMCSVQSASVFQPVSLNKPYLRTSWQPSHFDLDRAAPVFLGHAFCLNSRKIGKRAEP